VRAILPYRPLPFLAGIGGQVSPKQAVRLIRKLLLRVNFPINTGKNRSSKNKLPLPAPKSKPFKDRRWLSSHQASFFLIPELILAAGLTRSHP